VGHHPVGGDALARGRSPARRHGSGWAAPPAGDGLQLPHQPCPVVPPQQDMPRAMYTGDERGESPRPRLLLSGRLPPTPPGASFPPKLLWLFQDGHSGVPSLSLGYPEAAPPSTRKPHPFQDGHTSPQPNFPVVLDKEALPSPTRPCPFVQVVCTHSTRHPKAPPLSLEP